MKSQSNPPSSILSTLRGFKEYLAHKREDGRAEDFKFERENQLPESHPTISTKGRYFEKAERLFH